MQTFLKCLFFLIFFLQFLSLSAQSDYHIVFYNVENFYQVSSNRGSEDSTVDFPGRGQWSFRRFEQKAAMIYKAIMADSEGEFPDIIGLAEIENSWVAEELIKRTPFNKVHYRIVHRESEDPRGMDVALLYRKERIQPIDYEQIRVVKEGKGSFASRDILHFTCNIKETRLHFYINHWPSRSEGYTETREKRNLAARILRFRIDSLLRVEKDAKIVVLGDFNATPREKCLKDILGACSVKEANMDKATLVNLSIQWLDADWGTIKRAGKWEIFDQIICSRNLLGNTFPCIDQARTKICRASFLTESDIRYLGRKPFRTFTGPVFHGGISDHLPVSTVLSFAEIRN